ncbi:hypothetical protein MJK72_11650 [Klebsiella pneumoniae]|nr:hypothetical protein MJK72_11650 [Klebsiella pneumoniae]
MVVNYFMVMWSVFFRANGEGTTMQLLDLFAGLLWLSSVIFLLFVLDVINITRYLYRK